MTTIYTPDEIARHNHAKALWIVIHGDVYDLTKFYKEHPGGEEVLLELAGKDGSECFDSIGHSFEAITFRNTLKIGEMEKDGILEKPKAKADLKKSTEEQDENDWQAKQQDDKKRKSSFPLVATAVAVYAFVVYYIWFW